MQKKKVLRIIILALIIIWMIIVFKLSNQNGDDSGSLSREVASKITSDEQKIDIIEPYIRKIAHLSEYTIGGILFLSLFLTYELTDIKRMIFSLIIGIEYATLDEIHQLFINGRSGQMMDVVIDSVGVLIGISIMMILYKLLQKKKEGVTY